MSLNWTCLFSQQAQIKNYHQSTFIFPTEGLEIVIGCIDEFMHFIFWRTQEALENSHKPPWHELRNHIWFIFCVYLDPALMNDSFYEWIFLGYNKTCFWWCFKTLSWFRVTCCKVRGQLPSNKSHEDQKVETALPFHLVTISCWMESKWASRHG